MKSLIKNLDREKVILILKWCESHFGRSRFHRKAPKLRVYRSTGSSSYKYSDGGLFGTYGNGVITIYLGSHNGMKQLCYTVIHEYRHYLLSIREYRSLSRIMEREGSNLDYLSWNHPHEIECRDFEKKWGDLCFSELRKELYSKS